MSNIKLLKKINIIRKLIIKLKFRYNERMKNKWDVECMKKLN